jgi:DnaJ-class molecular chaperone
MVQKETSSWDILGLSPGASSKEIQKAYRKKAQIVHPDHGGTEEEFIALQQAAEFLLAKSDWKSLQIGHEVQIDDQTFFTTQVPTTTIDPEGDIQATTFIVSRINPLRLKK